MKVLISTSSFGKADSTPLEICQKRCDIVLNPYGRKLTTEEFIELTSEVDAVIAGVEKITREALIRRPNIRVISRCGVGMDNIDQNACKELNINLYNTPNAPVDSVAELTVSIMLDVVKNVSNMNSDLKNGSWNKMTGFLLKGKHIGIIGFGRIGHRVAELLSGFGVKIAYTDIRDMGNQYTYMKKEDLLSWADIVTIHASECKDGEFIIDKKNIQLMKETSFLINTSRGRFIDEDILFEALETRRIQGAALDVFTEEPYKGKLCKLDNVILTPHISSSAKEGRATMEMEAVKNLFKGLGINYD